MICTAHQIWDEAPGKRKQIHNDDLYDLYFSPNIIRVIKSRRMRWAGSEARMGERTAVYRIFVGKTEGKRILGRPNCWLEDLQEVGCVPWTGLIWLRIKKDGGLLWML